MWLGAKYSSDWARENGRSRGGPGGMVRANPTTVEDLADFNRLKDKFPDVDPPKLDEYGMVDQEAYLKLLRDLERQQNEPQSDDDLAASVPPVARGGMPQRVPGWWTGDAMDAPPPDWGTPPMSRRDPGATMRSPVSPSHAPRQQTHDEWVQGLAQKGIYLNPDGTRMTPEQMVAPLPRRPLRTGPDIWHQFVDAPSYSGRQLVSAFMKMAISDRLHQTMLDNGWSFSGHYPGQSGSYYTKRIGDRNHIIVKDSDWLHNSGPADVEPDEDGIPYVDEETPQGFTDLGNAVLHAEKGNTHAGFSSRRGPSTVEDSSYHPERTERTAPMTMLPGGPQGPGGKFQTLNSVSWEEM